MRFKLVYEGLIEHCGIAWRLLIISPVMPWVWPWIGDEIAFKMKGFWLYGVVCDSCRCVYQYVIIGLMLPHVIYLSVLTIEIAQTPLVQSSYSSP